MSKLSDEEAVKNIDTSDVSMEDRVTELEDSKKEQIKKNCKLKNKVSNRNILIMVLILIIMILLFKSCSIGERVFLIKMPELEDAEYVQPDEVADIEHQQGTTAIPVISDFTVKKSYPYATLFNPESNSGYSYLLYKFTDADTGDVIYESKLVEPGKKFSVAFGDMLETGTYNVNINIYAYDYNNPEIMKSARTSTNIKLTVTE